ncbi:uncharacterized protein LOC120522662 [Polypterus senegalus]|uniref:uncharacterized protein LOC120522662 n=1 Tax=Polypterus senegalus TaxID=55291 RepID=UPI00196276F2|nr:uncharacterized protein LOC120522662 [Polypterus senegalus]
MEQQNSYIKDEDTEWTSVHLTTGSPCKSLKNCVMEQKLVHIKEEDCEWGPVHHGSESHSIKVKDSAEKVSIFKKEESEEGYIGNKMEDSECAMRNYETVKILKEDLSLENDFSPPAHPTLQKGATKKILCSSWPQLNPKFPPVEAEITRHIFCTRETKQQICTMHTGIDLQESHNFSQSSVAQTLLQCSPDLKRQTKNHPGEKASLLY